MDDDDEDPLEVLTHDIWVKLGVLEVDMLVRALIVFGRYPAWRAISPADDRAMRQILDRLEHLLLSAVPPEIWSTHQQVQLEDILDAEMAGTASDPVEEPDDGPAQP